MDKQEFTAASTSQHIRKLIPVDIDLKLDEDDKVERDVEFNSSQTDISTEIEFHVSKLSRKPNQIACNDKWSYNQNIQKSRIKYNRVFETQLEFYDLATSYYPIQIRKHESNEYYNRQSKKNDIFNREISFVYATFEEKKKTDRKQNLYVSPTMIYTQNSENNIIRKDGSKSMQKSEQINFDRIFFEEQHTLTFEEIVHIRSILTKAELESLPIEGHIKSDVENRRVCFLCLKSRFSLLGPWGQRCRICERTVCAKCYSKMKIPTNNYDQVPITLLSPNLLSPSASSISDPKLKHTIWSKSHNSVGNSLPSSPLSKKYNSVVKIISQPLKGVSNQNEKSKIDCSPGGKSKHLELDTQTTKTSSVIVCYDCRLLITQIIQRSHSTRASIRNNVLSRLTLNLSPSYI